MPNGKPGDHPYTDIVTHGYDIPNEEVATIVRQIAESNNGSAKDEARRLLWQAGGDLYAGDEVNEELEPLVRDLRSLAAELQLSKSYQYESPLDASLDDEESVYSASVRQLIRNVHAEIETDVENDWWVYRNLNGILWGFGWETDQLDELEGQLLKFRDETVREQ